MRAGIVETIVITALFTAAIGAITLAADRQAVRVCAVDSGGAESGAASELRADISGGLMLARRLEE